jgi:hypothetical protein
MIEERLHRNKITLHVREPLKGKCGYQNYMKDGLDFPKQPHGAVGIQTGDIYLAVFMYSYEQAEVLARVFKEAATLMKNRGVGRQNRIEHHSNPQDVCPKCKSDNIANEDPPASLISFRRFSSS